MCGMILVMDMDTKYCSKCGENKPRTEYVKNINSYDGLNARCKPCRNEDKRRYREANRGKIEAYNRYYRELDPEAHRQRAREYKALNPVKRAEWDNKRRVLKRQMNYVPVSEYDLKMKLQYYGGKCWICRTAEHEHWDHVKPLSKGGAHILANLRPSCEACNLSKHNKWPFTRPN